MGIAVRKGSRDAGEEFGSGVDERKFWEGSCRGLIAGDRKLEHR